MLLCEAESDGEPSLNVTLGPASAVYGIYAAISSFIFQLPVMLVLSEVHTWIRARSPQLPPPDAALAIPISSDAKESTQSNTADGPHCLA